MAENLINFEELLNQFHFGIFRYSLSKKTEIVFVNAAFVQMLGYSRQEFLHKEMEGICNDFGQFKSITADLKRLGKIEKEEIVFKTKSKKALYCSVSLNLVKDKKGKVKWVDGVVEDISDQRQIRRELLESKGLFQTVFNNSAAAITVTDKDERIVAWNPFAEKMLGMDKKDLFNKPVKELYPPQEWRRMRSFRIRKKGMLSDIETQVIHKDGTILDANVSISVLKDIDGHIIGSIGIMLDISKQKQAERKIKESENKIRVILDNSAVAITLTDEHERIVSWNSYTEEMLGKKKQELHLQPVSSLYPPEEWKRIRAENIRQMGSKHHFETKVFDKNGNLIDVDLSVNVLKDANKKIIGSVGIMQDITQQKRIQQMLLQAKITAEEANSSKSLFLANMSHEVRTPMNTVMGMIDLTLDTDLTDEQRSNLATVKDAADNLLSLLNDILDLSRVEAGKINLETIELNIHNILKSVCKGLSVIAKKKDLDVVWEIDPNVPQLLIGDPVRIRQVLVNLINNAIKFTFKGNILTKVAVKSIDEEKCELQLSVKDEGIGISKDKQESIFDVFTQADVSTTRKFGGTGLGLTISKKLVEMMGGRIWVESEEDKGSTFYFTAVFKTVKRASEPVVEMSVQNNTLPQEKKNLENLSILLAEDNKVNQKIAVRILEKQGWKVKAVENGQEVLDSLEKETFDLILMDAQMPVLDGFETTKLIRDNERTTGKHIPIIALTARAMDDDRRRCLDCGMDGYVSKPIDRNKLYEEIENLFKKEMSYE